LLIDQERTESFGKRRIGVAGAPIAGYARGGRRLVDSSTRFEIDLPPDLAEAVRERVASGRYGSESEVIADGISRLVEEDDDPLDPAIAAELARGYDEWKANPEATIPLEEVARRLKIALPERLAESVRAWVESGEFADESEVVATGLALLEDRERRNEDPEVEAWLHGEVVPAYRKWKASGEKGLTAEEVRASLARRRSVRHSDAAE
jgi:putative addiction module CopG family antidote